MGAAARAAGLESLPLRERPVKAYSVRRLRMFDGNGFSESDKVGRPVDPKPETNQYKERESESMSESASEIASCILALMLPALLTPALRLCLLILHPN